MEGQCTTRTYTLSPSANRTALTSYAPGAEGTCQASTAASTTTWSYDSADRVTTGGYGYDALGRTTTVPAVDTQQPDGGDLTATYHVNDLVHTMSHGGRTRWARGYASVCSVADSAAHLAPNRERAQNHRRGCVMPPVIAFVAWCSLPAVVFGVVQHAGVIGRAVRRAVEAVRPPALMANAVPIERLAADLRRLAALLQQYERPEAKASMAKRLATNRAYEDRLAEACAALEIPHRLGRTSGWEHALELTRAESALLNAGLAFAPPGLERRRWP